MSADSNEKPRRWWLAGLLALLSGGIAGYLYVGRPRMALVAAVATVVIAFLMLGPSGAMADPVTGVPVFAAAFAVPLFFVVHAIVLAVRSPDYVLRSWNRWWVYAVAAVAVVALNNGMWQLTSTRLFSVPAASMEPTLRVGENFAADLRPWELRRGDVILFQHGGDTVWMKRLVGLPGDSVQMVDGILHINGEAAPRERIDDYVDAEGTNIARYAETLPDGASYETLDLSPSGFLDNTQVFEVPDGHVFVVGDNRDNSTDSRVPLARGGVGFVPVGQIIARAAWIHLPSEPSRFGKRLD